MAKLVLFSVIIASIAIPARAAHANNPREGLRKTMIQVALFNLVYVFLLMFVWGRL